MTATFTDEGLLNAAHLVVRSSPISGKGLFSTRAFRTGDILMIIAGEIIDAKESRRRESEGNFSIYFHGDDRFIDPPAGAKARYSNHSCEPNTIPETRDDSTLYLRALRDIAPGEELTIDYDCDHIYDICRQRNPLCQREKCPITHGR